MKKIQFMAMSIEVEDKYPKPQAASHYVPDWYKKAKRFRSGKMEILPEGAGLNKDLKLCMPFLDAITAGYVIELPGDLLVHRDERVSSVVHGEEQWQCFNTKYSYREDYKTCKFTAAS